jgi:hypothetical protein
MKILAILGVLFLLVLSFFGGYYYSLSDDTYSQSQCSNLVNEYNQCVNLSQTCVGYWKDTLQRWNSSLKDLQDCKTALANC